ncbi:MAG: outer membrane protein assembly factor BamA, partial [Deltaproteobacteria bacterium]|nr:outer membrane protein assembly factor BamA [Deltaproteobacteria bacterium]
MNSVPVSAPAGVHFSSRKRKIRLLSGCSAAHAAFRRLVTIICLTLFLGMFPAWTCVTPAWAARAGTPLNEAMIMVLPFQAQGSADNAKTADEITWMIAQRLNAKGLLVMPHDEMLRALGQQHGGEELDMAAARRILARSRANVALYGIYTQKGSSFSVDGRLVSSNPAEAPKAIRANQPDVSNLLFAVEDMAAQVNSEMRKNSVISRVEVRGTKALDADVVLLRINTRPGDPVDPLALDRELKRIWDLGYFSDIVLELEQSQTGIVLVYNVKEKPRISKITIKNAKAVNEADIRVAMSTQVGSVLNDKTMVTDLQAINELYRKKGHYLAASTYRLEHKTDNTAELIIDIEEGRQLFIKKIVLNGVKSFSERSVKGELALSERWLFSIFTDSGVLKEEMLERDVFSINAFYMNRGFMDVKVSPPKVNYEEDGITITYEVNEGPRYRVGGVSFAGELIDSDAVLSGLTEMSAAARKKEYFNLSVLQDDIKALSAYYAEYGYAFAAVSPQTKKGGTAADPSVSVVYVIEKRQKVYVRNIIIEGNHQTRDNVILREMRLVDGDAFNGKKLNRSIQRLNRLGHFEKAESELIPTSNPEETDLK